MKKVLLFTVVCGTFLTNVQNAHSAERANMRLATNAAIATLAGVGVFACTEGMKALSRVSCLEAQPQLDCSNTENYVPTSSGWGLLITAISCSGVCSYYAFEVGAVVLPSAWNRLIVNTKPKKQR